MNHTRTCSEATTWRPGDSVKQDAIDEHIVEATPDTCRRSLRPGIGHSSTQSTLSSNVPNAQFQICPPEKTR